MTAALQQAYARLEAWCFAHRIWATAPVVILLLAVARPTLPGLLIGGLVVVAGEAGRCWASGYIDKNRKLATAGPYRYTRNPLYFFNSVIFTGFCIMAANPWAALLGMAAFTVIYRPALRNEAAYMRRLFGAEYDQWAEQVPLFLPRPTGYPARGAHSWALVREHREHKNALAMAAGMALFVAIYLWQHCSRCAH
ncbi:MAG: isoprenylcysteine carboxylmethyltransferase family protein [Zetaproteobacteria bacterium]|nr:MAG: isoprenylcysteine carboxylmethyltransferase family protein [Zetaproteobacteria bacterium]